MRGAWITLAFSFDICSDFDRAEQALPLIEEELFGFEDSSGRAFRATWFVRADNQLRDLHGSEGYLFDRFGGSLRRLSSEGHEVGWHPHIYKKAGPGWALETDDGALEKHLAAGHSAARRHFDITAVRMGESYHSNRCMRLFDSLGLRVDSTAMPGRARNDDRKFDWTGTPAGPYHPSSHDYRVPGKDPLRILEVPMSMLDVRTSYDPEPLPRYLDLGFHSALMRDGISRLVTKEKLIVSITHPFELVGGPERHPLIAFDVREARRNLEFIVGCCREAGRPFRFATLSEVPALEGAI